MSFGAKNLLGMVHTVATGYDKSPSKIKIGYITAYDPAKYAVRVRLEPESFANEQAGVPNPVVETNWIPIYRPFGGDTWGFKSPPNADPSPPYGDQALVVLPDGGHGVAFVGFYNNVEKAYTDRDIGDPSDPNDPKPVAGEWQYVHKTGSFIKFRNDGTVMVFGKPQGLDGFPGSSLLYLTDDGEIELRDSENNFLKMYAKHQANRIELKDVEGNFLTLRGAQTTKIEIRDIDGNNIKLRGSENQRIEINDTAGNFWHSGQDVGGGARILIQDAVENKLEFRAGDNSRLRLQSADSHRLEFFSSHLTQLTSGLGISTFGISPTFASIIVGGGGNSGVVTLTHLAAVVAQINLAFQGKVNGSGSAGGVVAQASSKVFASD